MNRGGVTLFCPRCGEEFADYLRSAHVSLLCSDAVIIWRWSGLQQAGLWQR